MLGTSKNQFRWLFEVPCGTCLLGWGVNHQRLTLQRSMSLPPNPHPVEVFRCALLYNEKLIMAIIVIGDKTDSDLICQKQMLQGVSRTFALTIPALPSGLAVVVGNAYLLCRLADTIEDEPGIGWQCKQELSEQFIAVVAGEGSADQFASQLAPMLSDGASVAERELVANTGCVIRITHSFNSTQQAAILRCVRIMAAGMTEFQQCKPRHGLRDLSQLDRYCYYVAGVVGEMLTELFCDYSSELYPQRKKMLSLAVSFGQALQMTNILKDIWEDRRRGACWLPQDLFRAAGYDLSDLNPDSLNQAYQTALNQLIGIARQHLDNAMTYTLMLPRREIGMRRFCLWALAMAVLTLRKIHARPDFTAAGQVKISRRSVKLTIHLSDLIARSDHALGAVFYCLTRRLPIG